jgi:hypothetical protein
VLKAIDFGGSILLPSILRNSNSRERPEKLRKMTSTPHILPPEFDRLWLNYCHENLSHQQRENEAAVAEENKKKTIVKLKHKGEITEEENDNVNNYENIANMAIDVSGCCSHNKQAILRLSVPCWVVLFRLPCSPTIMV